MLSDVIGNLKLLFQRPLRLQVAALCYRKKRGGLQVLLITSRGTGRWILPKGWPMDDRAAHEAAALEAYEEAGVRGECEPTAFATVPSTKGLDNGMRLQTSIRVYPLKVEKELKDYPEKGQRQRQWLPIEEAAERIDEPELRPVLRTFGDIRGGKKAKGKQEG